ncbi:alkane 1-monooxygenase [Loktanella salsilacus]|uniref:alkane 1-monooxygenase n=1 Tax=Loktanella salsilacus TaxID=195913 RepID=UPI0020B8B3E7|nr:alkane 1-monooxygenase [Loktanella salsilacus]UTH47983.1 alkane 1-monooxygenase [Loktanella salsilacus]
MTATAATPPIARLSAALPFWLSLLLIPIAWISAVWGGWAVFLLPLCTWYLFGIIDIFAGLNEANADTSTPDDQLWWYRLITIIWAPLQAATLFGVMYYATRADHLGGWELVGLFFGMGVITGTIGINYSHELMHQKPKIERNMADILLAMALYSHFRSEHLLVHHRYVATPRDPVTARYNEGFHRFFPRVLRQCYTSAFKAERAMLARKNLPWTDLSNPFWRYWALQAGFLALSLIIGGWLGLALFLWQAFVAAWHLELVNYIEHYGLTREHLGDGKYEYVKPHHSWNSAQKVSNWLLINLQRHSDHHYKPDRRFPLLQTYDASDAPQLPYGYSVMGFVAMVPPLWRRAMNPRVRAWRRQYYPHITDWSAYKAATNPWPR